MSFNSANENIDLPEVIPAMTLPETVLFPNALLPLFIFEEHYREMLSEALESDRMFAIVQRNDSDDESNCHEVGTVGIIRASHANEDGTTHVVLQGVTRVKVIEEVKGKSFPQIRIEPLKSECDLDDLQLRQNRKAVDSLVHDCATIETKIPKEMIDFLDDIDEDSVYLDLSIQTLCTSAVMKQRLLETPKVSERFAKFIAYLKLLRSEESLFKRLQGKTKDSEIDLN